MLVFGRSYFPPTIDFNCVASSSLLFGVYCVHYHSLVIGGHMGPTRICRHERDERGGISFYGLQFSFNFKKKFYFYEVLQHTLFDRSSNCNYLFLVPVHSVKEVQRGSAAHASSTAAPRGEDESLSQRGCVWGP